MLLRKWYYGDINCGRGIFSDKILKMTNISVFSNILCIPSIIIYDFGLAYGIRIGISQLKQERWKIHQILQKN